MKSLLPSFRALKEREASEAINDEKEEENVDEREHSVQRDYLKQELDQVLKGIREMGDEGVEKHVDVDSAEDDNPINIKVDHEEINSEESNSKEVDPCERSTSRTSETSDITLAFEDNDEDPEDVRDNTLEEMSAL